MHDEQLCIEKKTQRNATAPDELEFFHIQIKSEESNMFVFESNEAHESYENNVAGIPSADVWRPSVSDDEKSASANAQIKLGSKNGLTVHTTRLDDINKRTEVEQQQTTGQCEICEKTMQTSSLRHHMKHDHRCTLVQSSSDDIRRMREKNLCTICDRTFSTPSNLRKHLKIHARKNGVSDVESDLFSHDDGKPHKCNVCSKRFARKAQAKQHMRTHTGEKPYKCDIDGCNRAYGYQIDLQRHKFGAHGIYHKKFPCSICERIYPENKLLRRHMGLAHPELDQ